MKRIILIIAITMLTLYCIVNAQTIDTINISETERIFDKYSTKFEVGIIALAESLKTPAEHVYKVLIRQQYVVAITWTTILLIILLITITCWIFWFKDKTDKDEWWGVPAFITTTFIVTMFSTINKIITGLINPEYGAIKDIIDFVK